METLEIESPEIAKRSHRRTWMVALVAVLTVVLAVGVVGWRYYQVGLFDDYRAGYNAVPAGLEGLDQASPCGPELLAVWPGLAGPGEWPVEATAFRRGCLDKMQGIGPRPWKLHDLVGNSD